LSNVVSQAGGGVMELRRQRAARCGSRGNAGFDALRPGRVACTQVADLNAEGWFSGYASFFEQRDGGGDIVSRGAFSKSLESRGPAKVKLLLQHDPAQPVGYWTRIEEDDRGLYVEGRLVLDVVRAREAHALMRAGALDGLSIGFKTVRARRDRLTGLRRLDEVELWEISVVTFPMLPTARVGLVKQRRAPMLPGQAREGRQPVRLARKPMAKRLALARPANSLMR